MAPVGDNVTGCPRETVALPCALDAELARVWTLPPLSTLVLVTGLEASGTKEATIQSNAVRPVTRCLLDIV